MFRPDRLVQPQDLDPSIPGYGLISRSDLSDWNAALAMLPPSIADDPNSKFCNPKLAAPLRGYLEQYCRSANVSRISEDQFLEILEDGVSPGKIGRYLSRINAILMQREDNPYHGGYHSRSEVPQRLRAILSSINQSEVKSGTLNNISARAILFAAAPTHDLFHSGVGYSQRLTPGLNISNEERAVTLMVDIALDSGLSPLHVLEMQRIILPTSFSQKPEQLGVTDSPAMRIGYLDLDGLPNETFPKADLAREYDPDASPFLPTRKMAQVLALADVCITLGSMEQWIERSVLYYQEVKIGQGNFPKTAQELGQEEILFLNEHVLTRLEACKPFLIDDFYNQQRANANEFAERLQNALRHPESANGVLLQRAVERICEYEVRGGPNLDGLMSF